MIDVTVVLGAGSPLMGDDGLGVEIVERLREIWAPEAELLLLDGGTWGMSVLPHIESARRLLLIDAIHAGREPGTIIRLDRDALPRHLNQKLSPHQIDLGEVLALAELRGTFPSEAVALGIEPDRIELRDGLSAKVRESVPALIEAIHSQLADWGHALEPVSVAAALVPEASTDA